MFQGSPVFLDSENNRIYTLQSCHSGKPKVRPESRVKYIKYCKFRFRHPNKPKYCANTLYVIDSAQKYSYT